MKRLGGLLAFLFILATAMPARASTVLTWQMDSLPPEQGSVSVQNGGVLGIDVNGMYSGTGAYIFDGNERILDTDAGLDPGTSDFTVTVHVKTTVVPNDVVGDYDLIRKGLAGDKRYWKVELFPNAANTKAFAFCQMRGFNSTLNAYQGARLKYTGANMADGQWHTITCSKTSTGVDLLVDGVQRIHNSHVLGDIHNTKPLSIGAKAPAWDDEYTGEMDEVTYSIG